MDYVDEQDYKLWLQGGDAEISLCCFEEVEHANSAGLSFGFCSATSFRRCCVSGGEEDRSRVHDSS